MLKPQNMPDTGSGQDLNKTKSAEPGSYQWMMRQAQALNIPGRTTMDKATLADAIGKASKEHGGKRTVSPRSLPVAADVIQSAQPDAVPSPDPSGAMPAQSPQHPPMSPAATPQQPQQMTGAALGSQPQSTTNPHLEAALSELLAVFQGAQ